MTRDPRSDPQPGDEFRRDGQPRQVIQRDGDRILVDAGRTRYWMRVDRWREWCQKNGAEAAKAANQA